MSYSININSADPREFIFGTSFFGENFSSKEELKDILKKYLPKKDVVIKITFTTSETISKMKFFGDKLAAEGKNIDIFSLASFLNKDKFNNIAIYYLPCGWKDNNGTFKFILEKNDEIIPQYNKKFFTILSDLGINL